MSGEVVDGDRESVILVSESLDLKSQVGTGGLRVGKASLAVTELSSGSVELNSKVVNGG